MKKGSKCKCKPQMSQDERDNLPQHLLDDPEFNKPQVCGNFCKRLSSRQQKKIIKKLLLEHFKTTVENTLKSNQKLDLNA